MFHRAHEQRSCALAKFGKSGRRERIDLLKRARHYAAASKSENTRRAYRSDWATFAAWCRAQGLESLPAAPETVALFLTARAEVGKNASTLTRCLAAISEAHHAIGLPTPRGASAVKAVLRGIRRTILTAPRQKLALLPDQLKAMLEGLPQSLGGLRDRALLLVGFSGAFRRSELVGLNVEDIVRVEDGLEITLRRSKTDQEGGGRKVGLPFGSNPATCPVRSLARWQETSSVTSGAIFRSVNRHDHLGDRLSDRAVALIVKRAATTVGIEASRLAGHSLRAGLATAAAKAGKSERSIMSQTGHRSERMVRNYVREASLFTENAANGLL